MKHKLLLVGIMLLGLAKAQNIADNKVNFSYIQLPSVKIAKSFTKYEVRAEHDYLKANEDSLSLYKARVELARKVFEEQLVLHQKQKDSIDRAYFSSMASWERNANLGMTNPDGTALSSPTAPVYPTAPTMQTYKSPILHTEFADNKVTENVSVQGYEKGLGGFIVTYTLHGIRHSGITETKKNSGAETKYEFKAGYVLPITIKVETPTQGVVWEQKVLENVRYTDLKSHKTSYDHKLYMLDHKEEVYKEIEEAARTEAIRSATVLLNEKIGYLEKGRQIEVYSVNNHKGYDYSDVTTAYTTTTQALILVKNDRNRSGAQSKIDEAIAQWKSILTESNLRDSKARINDKITAMIQCNLAELYVWKADFNNCDLYTNLALNSGEGKAKRYIRDQQGFYADQKARWKANY